MKRLLSPFCRAPRLLSVSSWSSSTFRLVGISFSFLLRGRRLLWRFRLRCAKFLVGERLLCRFRRGRRLLYRFRRELSRRRRLNLFVFVVVRVCRRFRDRCHRARRFCVCPVVVLLVVLCACSLDRAGMLL